MRKSYAEGLSSSEAAKIFKTLPDHVFWDIKKPRSKDLDDDEMFANPYNPARADPTRDFFDARVNEQWLKDKKEQKNINPTVSRQGRQY